ncbi:hypothetical protein K2173_000344 [Erythroxylum novogranatense]|uniref:Phloem protein 2 n=1 Tax=Erythroxylum novogranatense TaxID=1862640 RepID=A0AAV8SWB0_9ROSI|nr:hypothetical protein K2173_000344 [Erythroxylum novogranatense]
MQTDIESGSYKPMVGLGLSPHRESDGSKPTPLANGTVVVPVNALNIIWGNDQRFWKLIRLSEEDRKSTGFTEGMQLVQVNWIEVTGKLPKSTFRGASACQFEIYYIVKFQSDAFGWHSIPIKFKVKDNGSETVKKVMFEPYRDKNQAWQEIPGGVFKISSDWNGVVEFGMLEVESNWWKGGIVLGGVKIKPKAG